MYIFKNGFILLVLFNCSVMVAIITTLNMNDNIYRKTFTMLTFLLSVIVFCVCYIGVSPEDRGGKEWSDESFALMQHLIQEFNLEEENDLYRYRDAEIMLNDNYPLITNTPSLSTWLHLVSRKSKRCLS